LILKKRIMAKIFRYLFSILAHVAWRRSGKSGPLPHFKAPGKRTTRLPIPSPWQVMVATWILERLWKEFGDDVKHKLTHTKSPAVNRLGQMIPAPGDAAQAQPAQSQPALAGAPQGNGQPSQSTAQAPNYDTQKLQTGPLPSGSVLSSLRSS
jgi:hypothetical protein